MDYYNGSYSDYFNDCCNDVVFDDYDVYPNLGGVSMISGNSQTTLTIQLIRLEYANNCSIMTEFVIVVFLFIELMNMFRLSIAI